MNDITMKTDEQIVRESFDGYIKSLVELKEAVNGLRIQTKATNKALENILSSTHLTSVLRLTRETEFIHRITPRA